jgi:hypothetical protein
MGIRHFLKLSKRSAELKRELRKGPDCIFIWTPKNAGTSTYLALNQSIGMVKLKRTPDVLAFPNTGPVTFGHYHILSLLKIGVISNSHFENAFKFAITRDPYRRVLSLYHYLTWGKLAPKYSFDHFLDDVIKNAPPVGCYHVLGLSQANPQMDWISDGKGGVITDQLIKVENVQSELEHRFQRPISLSKSNSSSEMRNHTVDNLSFTELISSNERLDKIESFYHRDFEFLGYDKIKRR